MLPRTAELSSAGTSSPMWQFYTYFYKTQGVSTWAP